METPEEKLKRAKKRVEEIKGFYIHLSVFVFINLMLLIVQNIRIFYDGRALFQWYSLYTPLFWGIGLAFHGAKVFGWLPFFGKKWEDEQIRKYMEKDRKEAEKFK